MIVGTSSYNRWADTLANIGDVPAQVEAARVRLALSFADQATKIGIGVDTLSKLGPTSARTTLEKCLLWLASV